MMVEGEYIKVSRESRDLDQTDILGFNTVLSGNAYAFYVLTKSEEVLK